MAAGNVVAHHLAGEFSWNWVALTEDGTDDDVGVGRFGEQPLEGFVEGVGENEGADYERDPQHDGERAQPASRSLRAAKKKVPERARNFYFFFFFFF